MFLKSLNQNQIKINSEIKFLVKSDHFWRRCRVCKTKFAKKKNKKKTQNVMGFYKTFDHELNEACDLLKTREEIVWH